MFDYIRAAAVVPDVLVGNVRHNVCEINKKLAEASKNGADIIIFPELALTGYTCGDLFLQTTLQDEVNLAISEILKTTVGMHGVAVFGAPIKINGQLYNCAVVVQNGKVLGIVPKTFLPNYNEFYEKRWFSSAADLTEYSIVSHEITDKVGDGYEIPVGNELIFDINGKYKFGIEICEDLWTPLSPSTFLALNGAEVILNISASNEIIAKREYRRELVKMQSAKNICAYVYASAGSGESTTDLVFSGNSIIAENGTVLNENKSFVDNDYILFSDIDLGKIKSDRNKLKTFKDSAALYTKTEKCRNISVKTDVGSDGTLYNIKRHPFVPSDKTKRLQRCMNIFNMQVAGLKKRMSVTGGKLVIGVSGGLDSTLALLVCAEAVKQLGRNPEDVIGVTMPCFGTSERTFENSLKLMESLGISRLTVPIKEACELHCRDIGHDIDIHDITYENVQARERTQVLMDISNRMGGIVVGTGDLSELALGWCTYNADHMSMYGVNSSIPKTLIKWMIDSIAENNVFEKSSEVLRDIIDTPISPELLPPDENGKIAQKTEDVVGPYELHDFFLYYMLRFGFSPSKIYYMAKRAFGGEFDDKTILKWLKVYYKRFFTQQFKRSCLPDGVKVGSVCLSPRGDWRMPSDASSAIWLNEIETLK